MRKAPHKLYLLFEQRAELASIFHRNATMIIANIKAGHRGSRFTAAVLGIVIFTACHPAKVKVEPVRVEGEDATPSRPPTAEQIQASTAPGYRSPAGVKQDCFGRLVFDVADRVEWPVFYDENTISVFDRSFSPDVADRGDQMRYGNTRVAVIASVNGVPKERILDSTPNRTEAQYKAWIEEKKFTSKR